MDKEKNEIDAVHEEDLQEVLRRIGLWDRLLAGDLKCRFCKTNITAQNLHSIFPQPDGEFSLICDKPVCVKNLMEYLQEKNEKKIG